MQRRPIRARSSGWATLAAAWLARSGISPNQISMASMVFALLGALAFGASRWNVWLLLAAAACIQLRLLCKLFDGMVAVEGGKRSAMGELYNEIPDRISDALFLVAAGYTTAWPELGWAAAVLAVGTAYVRAFGASLGNGNDFAGPLAKQQRMALLTAACIAAPVEHLIAGTTCAMPVALGLISVLTAWTCVRRTSRLTTFLRGRGLAD
jgi:phosphatidylglycerophosphate synthase